MTGVYVLAALRVVILALSTVVSLAAAVWIVWDGRLGATGVVLALILAACGLLGLAGTAYNVKHFKEP